MRAVVWCLLALALVGAIGVRPAGADSWTELDEASGDAFGRAWFHALRADDPSKVDAYLPTVALVDEAIRAIRARHGEAAARQQLLIIERDGGLEARLGEVRNLVRASVHRLSTSTRLVWKTARLEGVTLEALDGRADWPVARTHNVVVLIRDAGDLHRLRVPAIATPHGPRVPLALLRIGFIEQDSEDATESRGFRLRVGFDVAKASTLELGGPDASPEAVTAAVAREASDFFVRASSNGFEGVEVHVVSAGLLAIDARSQSQTEHVQSALSQAGSVGRPTQMRVEVVAVPAQQPDRAATPRVHAPTFPRDRIEAAPWQGAGDTFPATEAGLAAYLAHEVDRYLAARRAKLVYQPTDARYELVFGPKQDDWSVENAHLLEAERSPFTFEAATVHSVRVGMDHLNNGPTVLYDLTGVGAERLGKWSERNLGLPAAIIVDGRWTIAPRINGRLTNSVQISMGPGTREAAEAEAKQRVASLLGPVSSVALSVLSIEPR
ncbi:MAG: hypothetical protein KDB73_15695 [Planctomycetes bacterium]|nr:hypothetical protein [Planctomycetota bacterium]